MTDDDARTVDRDAFRIPTISELDAIRTDLGLSQRELSRRAGLEDDRFNCILRRDMDPRSSTLRAFLDVLQEADAKTEEELNRPGPKPEASTLAQRLENTDASAVATNRGETR
jgi:transcriptional regulator with XRE-family HTH domain